ncbi:MAG: argininosuccinate lyase [Sulfurospirillaceae bacterium]|jgi:argininosuccinate lyase|nr:argininosuccinate lyase [Sulfurospirillaceae bacterium]MCK9546625.1 argininosuccinate lyase [Sulfurospirillaceae bacterium]MDY0237225.1 argininosuccinate lyase [Campylobacterales bacterium]
MGKLWSGRFDKNSSKLLDIFNASLPFDKILYEEDIKGSIAHATMLASQGILTQKEADLICDGLKQIKDEIKEGKFTFDIGDEDIHMSIEKRLIELIGEIGGKLHTARSRNDQVALDFRLYVLKSNKVIMELIKDLIKTLHTLALPHTSTLMPGMTHLQHAQPINFAYHLMAYISMFLRDFKRFEFSSIENSVLPLGCAALAGTPHPIDRQKTAQLLGFEKVSLNCLDTVSDRDFALEILFNISTLLMHISRLSEELILWSSAEFGFVTFSDEYSTGSSIMPQKKNPDIPELLRGKTGRVYGNLIGLLTVLKGLPLAYNKDLQEDKEGVFDSVDTAVISLKILSASLLTLTINEEAMLKACKIGHLSATDLADYLVSKCNIPFRQAHHITGRAVLVAEKKGCDLSELSYEELKEVDSRIKPEVSELLTLSSSMNARNSQGGTSSKRTKEQLDFVKNWLSEN